MRRSEYTHTDAQRTTTPTSTAPTVLETPQTLRGAIVTVLGAVLVFVTLMEPIMGFLTVQAAVFGRYVGPPAIAHLRREWRTRRQTRGLPEVIGDW